jgi:ABC-type sugar transport system substrate-binding protein
MVEHLQGKPVEKLVDTGVQVVTPDNVNKPEMQTLLKPPINDYLQ